MKKLEFCIGIATLALVGYYAWTEGGRQGDAMAHCVKDKMDGFSEYMSDKKIMYRLSVSACHEYNRDNVVKIPVDG